MYYNCHHKSETQTPNIKYQAHHTIFNEIISIGTVPSVILFNCIGGYLGWTNYLPVIEDELKKIFDLGILSKIQRVGLRYMSFFEGQRNFFNNVNISVGFENERYQLEQTNVRTTIRLGEARQYRATFQLNDKVTLENDGNGNEGALTDIDVAFEIPFSADYDKLIEIIDAIHFEVVNFK